MFVGSSKVKLRLHISHLADEIYNDWESYLACLIQVVLKVIRNFSNSFMKHPSAGGSYAHASKTTQCFIPQISNQC